MELLEFMTITCTNASITNILNVIRKVMMILYIAVPVLIVLFGTIDLLKAVVAQKDDEMKKAWSTLLKRLIYGVAIFLLGTVVNLALSLVGKNIGSGCGIS